MSEFSNNDIKETEAKLEMPLLLSSDQTLEKSRVLYELLAKHINEINNLLIKVGPSVSSQEKSKWNKFEQNLSVRMRSGQVITMLEFREQRRGLQQWKQHFNEILLKIEMTQIRIADSMISYGEGDMGQSGTKRFKQN